MVDTGRSAASDDIEQEDLPKQTVTLLARIVPRAFGIAVGSVGALVLFVATVALVVKGGEVVGPHLGLIGQYLPGYSVSLPGAVIGAGYAFVLGFAAGWTFARVRNAALGAYLRLVYTRAEHHVASDLLDRLS